MNILVIMSDQHHPRITGYRGHPHVQTPNLDRLAREEAQFTRATCTNPICTPSRMSMITAKDTACLRQLATRVAEIAALPEQAEKRRAVIALNRLDPVAPRIYCFPEGAWLECIPPETLVCEDPLLRGWETRLRMAIYTHEFLRDDQPIDAIFNVPWDGGVGDTREPAGRFPDHPRA